MEKEKKNYKLRSKAKYKYPLYPRSKITPKLTSNYLSQQASFLQQKNHNFVLQEQLPQQNCIISVQKFINQSEKRDLKIHPFKKLQGST